MDKRQLQAWLLSADAIVFVCPVLAAAPYPPSTVITGITWAPVSSIVRQALDSDNWPSTWGDDDSLYTAYGVPTRTERDSPRRYLPRSASGSPR